MRRASAVTNWIVIGFNKSTTSIQTSIQAALFGLLFRTNPRITFGTAGARRMNWASLVLLAQTLSLKKGSLNTLFAPYFHLICPRPAKKKEKIQTWKWKPDYQTICKTNYNSIFSRAWKKYISLLATKWPGENIKDQQVSFLKANGRGNFVSARWCINLLLLAKSNESHGGESGGPYVIHHS